MTVTFFKLKSVKSEPRKGSWNNQDIADFYRAVDILKRAGLNTEVDSGVTDEGDPWFVFMKPENGEVIAHFAQIDGHFIAVSSLNQEVYKGREIRSIVDQMLERHPMLLPQNKNSGRLMLHPTAALSAFLAAAFILTIDGVRASNLTDIIVGVTSEEDGVTINNDAPYMPYGQRYESLKSMFSELNLANYNVAVLGAALIARELSHNELDFKFHSGEEDGSMATNNEEKQKIDGADLNLNINVEHDRSSGEINNGEINNMVYAVKSQDSNLSDQDGENGHYEDKFDGAENNQETKINAGLKEASNDNVSVFPGGYEVLWNNDDTILTNNYPKIQQINSNDVNEKFDATMESVPIERTVATEDVFSGLNLAIVLKSLQESFQIVPSSLRSETLLDTDGVGLTFNSAGELRIISLNSTGQRNLTKEPDREDFSLTEQLQSVASLVVSHENIEDTHNPLENGDNGTSDAQQIVYNKPIIGHSLNETNHTLSLTDAIDVVFYKGGDAEISKFELGTDLLWFFLSEEELETANNSVNDRGDLVLDFGDTGTLTFLGMVSDTVTDGMTYV
jgi:hypothetical protein